MYDVTIFVSQNVLPRPKRPNCLEHWHRRYTGYQIMTFLPSLSQFCVHETKNILSGMANHESTTIVRMTTIYIATDNLISLYCLFSALFLQMKNVTHDVHGSKKIQMQKEGPLSSGGREKRNWLLESIWRTGQVEEGQIKIKSQRTPINCDREANSQNLS